MVEQFHTVPTDEAEKHVRYVEALNAELDRNLRRLEQLSSSLETKSQSDSRSVRRIEVHSKAISEDAERIWKSAERIRRKQRLNRLTAMLSLLSIAFWLYVLTLPEGRAFLLTLLSEFPDRIAFLSP